MRVTAIRILRWLNIILPLLLGLLIYLTYRPDTMVTEFFHWLPFPIGRNAPQSGLERFLCNYGADILWAYSLTAYTMYWFQGVGKSQKSAVVLCLATELGVELFQLTGIIKATFDIWDIVLEFAVTGGIALICILKQITIRGTDHC